MKLRMSLEEMISNLDGAAGRLLVAGRKYPEVRIAMEMITDVSLVLGEIEEIKFTEYAGIDDDEKRRGE